MTNILERELNASEYNTHVKTFIIIYFRVNSLLMANYRVINFFYWGAINYSIYNNISRPSQYFLGQAYNNIGRLSQYFLGPVYNNKVGPVNISFDQHTII